MTCPTCQSELPEDSACPQCAGRKRRPSPYRVLAIIFTLAAAAVVAIFVLALLFPNWCGRELPWVRKRNIEQCMSNQKQLLVAEQMYIQDHDEQFSDEYCVWADLCFPPKALHCPSDPKRASLQVFRASHYTTIYGYTASYGYNVNLSELPIRKISSLKTTVVFTDCIRNDNKLRSIADIATTRHGNGFIAGFADGHVAFLPSSTQVMLMPK